MKRKLATVIVLMLAPAVAAAGEAPVARVYPRAQTPPEMEKAAAAAEGAMNALQQGLSARLMKEMAAGGPVAAVNVCRDEAQKITAQVAAEQGIALGRTSHKLRNPKNEPREWVEPWVEKWAGKKASEAEAVVVDLGDRVGVVRPIALMAPCAKCHGDPAGFADELKAALAAGYPHDQATGFAEGDLRGLFWAEVKK